MGDTRLRGRWERGYLASLGGTVGGGTSEIQRNIPPEAG